MKPINIINGAELEKAEKLTVKRLLRQHQEEHSTDIGSVTVKFDINTVRCRECGQQCEEKHCRCSGDMFAITIYLYETCDCGYTYIYNLGDTAFAQSPRTEPRIQYISEDKCKREAITESVTEDEAARIIMSKLVIPVGW